MNVQMLIDELSKMPRTSTVLMHHIGSSGKPLYPPVDRIGPVPESYAESHPYAEDKAPVVLY